MSVESSIKLLDYLSKVAKEQIIVDGVPFEESVPESVTLSESFFWKDNCVMCGRCCVNESTVWTQEGINRILSYLDSNDNSSKVSANDLSELSELIEQRVVNINGQDRVFYVCPKDKSYAGQWSTFDDRGERQRCHWLRALNEYLCCGIHPIRPVTCALPHIRFYKVKKTNRTILRIMQYGRNHKLGCPVEFGEVSEEGMQDKIFGLKLLNDCANDLGIKTWLPEIIQYLEEGNREPVTFGAPIPRRGGRVRGIAIKHGIKQMCNDSSEVSDSTKQRFSALLRRKPE